MPAANRASIETVDIGRGNHYEPRNPHFRPTRRSSTLRSDEWDYYDRSIPNRYERYEDYRPRYEEVDVYEEPVKPVSYRDNDYYDRWQEGSRPGRHYVPPQHTRGAQSQMVGVRRRMRSPSPVKYVNNERIIITDRSKKAASKPAAPVGHTGPSRAPNESQHVPGLFQTVFDVNHPQDASVHLELPITDDHDAELEEFCRLQRLGNFGAAEDYFGKKLETYLSNPYVFVQFGQMLLDKGDYLAFERLNPEAVFGKEYKEYRLRSRFSEKVVVVERDRSWPRVRSRSRSRSWSRSRERRRETRARSRSESPIERRARFEPDVRIARRRLRSRSHSPPVDNVQRYYERERYVDSDRSDSPDGRLQPRNTTSDPDYDELELLSQNWRLLNATSIIYSRGNYEDAFTEAWHTIENFHFETGIGSTEASLHLSLILLWSLTNNTDTVGEANPAVVCKHWAYSP